MLVKFKGNLFSVHSVAHRTPGNLRGFVQAKMRNMNSRAMIEHRFSSEDYVERVTLEEHEMEYLYNDGDVYHFMNTETFEQIGLNKDDLGDQVLYLLPNNTVNIQFYEGSPFSVNLPTNIDLVVVETEPETVLDELKKITPEAELGCFESVLTTIETDLDGMKERANAWAVGDVEALKRFDYPDSQGNCLDALFTVEGFADLRDEPVPTTSPT